MHKTFISILLFFYIARGIQTERIPDLSCCNLKFTRFAKRRLLSARQKLSVPNSGCKREAIHASQCINQS